MSSVLVEKIDEILGKNGIASRHSFFQLKYFVVGKQPTLQSKLWACLREMKARREAIKSINLEIAEVNDRLKLLDIEAERIGLVIEDNKAGSSYGVDPEEKRRALNIAEQEIKLRQNERYRQAARDSLTDLQERLNNSEQEATFFLQAFESLEKIEPYKGFDDLESQKEFWNEHLTHELNMRTLLRHPLDVETVNTVLALHNEAPIKQQVVQLLDNLQAKAVLESQKSEVKE